MTISTSITTNTTSKPCLTRQNAFLVEDYENITPLDSICNCCYNPDVEAPLIQPCQCKFNQKPTKAHEYCFVDWSRHNNYPTRCTYCKARYSIRPRKPVREVLEENKAKFIIMALSFIAILHITTHFNRCAIINSFEKDEFEYLHGESSEFKDIPDQFFLPIFNVECFYSSFVTSFSKFFISFYHCISISIVSSFLSFFILVSPYYYSHYY